jgi:hypothetical protein
MSETSNDTTRTYHTSGRPADVQAALPEQAEERRNPVLLLKIADYLKQRAWSDDLCQDPDLDAAADDIRSFVRASEPPQASPQTFEQWWDSILEVVTANDAPKLTAIHDYCQATWNAARGPEAQEPDILAGLPPR